VTPDEERRADLARAAEALQTAVTFTEEAGRVDLSNACYDLLKRVESAIELDERTITTKSGARIVTRGQAGGRTPSGGCLR